MMSPLTCIIIPLHAKVGAKVVDPTSIPSHYSMSMGYNHRILPLLDVEVEEFIEHVNDKEEEGMEYNRGSYGTSMHGCTLTTLNVLMALWTLIWASNFLLYYSIYSMSKNFSF